MIKSKLKVKRSIVLATSNLGKLKEMRSLLKETTWNVFSQSDFGVVKAIESKFTFVENALVKARNASQHTGLPTIADDSGLEVHALGGAPGIYSARYAGQDASDKENIKMLLYKLKNTPCSQRQARFICVVVYIKNVFDHAPLIFQGFWEGQIASHALGEQGFGYDPVFLVREYGCTVGELSKEKKNQCSHRAQALKQLKLRLL